MRHLLVLTIIMVFVAAGLWADQAPSTIVDPGETISTFSFSGLCSDCWSDGLGGYGRATATLTLRNYVLGDPINGEHLVSFVYDPTDIITSGFTINYGDPINSISGMFLPSLPDYADFHIHSGHGQTFDSDVDGGWSVMFASDMGTDGRWHLNDSTAPVPEPGAFVLLATAVALIGVRRWRVAR